MPKTKVYENELMKKVATQKLRRLLAGDVNVKVEITYQATEQALQANDKNHKT